jgi:hypothetical protein
LPASPNAVLGRNTNLLDYALMYPPFPHCTAHSENHSKQRYKPKVAFFLSFTKIMADDKTWPPATGITTKIVPREKAIVELSYSTIVHAPAPLVFDTILRVADYSSWNTWVPVVRITSQPPSGSGDNDTNDASRMRVGCAMEFDVIMDAAKPNNIQRSCLKVVDISTPDAPSSYLSPDLLADPTFTSDLSKVYRVAWASNGGMMGLAPTVERFHEVIVMSEDECEVRTWEAMSGMTARLVKRMLDSTLKEKVGLWCEDLKRYCEKKHAQEKASAGAGS